MTQYKVVMLENEYELEKILNQHASEGWRLHSLETEYKMGIVIFEREDNDDSQAGA